MGDGQSVEALQWLAYIGRTRNNVTHVVNGKEVQLSRVQNEKVEVYCAERKMRSFITLGVLAWVSFLYAQSRQTHW